ncbi:uncharacterized protein LOC100906466 [Galendromus occidentalis]|uniref:Uncharacterized protein LOC100906466 n=1 Tax=Galendromus occidentalis TaxID=34638 RepID=A0AAJ7PAM1_9ACAR|nr:uncharacterized protein LOC100906466 [Galendromus occidentalis]
MDTLSVKIMMDSEEVTQCLVDRPSCLIDDSQLKSVALEDERLPSEEPASNSQFLLGGVGTSYRQAPTRSLSQGARNSAKFQIYWDKTYFATPVGALRLSIMGCMTIAILLLSFFRSDTCLEPKTPSSSNPQQDDQPLSSSFFGIHLFFCILSLIAMVAWIAIDNSSFNYRFPFKWKFFDCCVYCVLIVLLLISSSVLVKLRNRSALITACGESVGKLDMAITFSFLAVMIVLTLITIRFFEKDSPQPSSRASANPLNWVRKFSKSKQHALILLQQVH